MTLKYADMIGNQSLMDWLELDDAMELEKIREEERRREELGDYNISKQLWPEDDD